VIDPRINIHSKSAISAQVNNHALSLLRTLPCKPALPEMGVVLWCANSWTNWNGTLFRQGRKAQT
jgi:hypothetical protein